MNFTYVPFPSSILDKYTELSSICQLALSPSRISLCIEDGDNELDQVAVVKKSINKELLFGNFESA